MSQWTRIGVVAGAAVVACKFTAGHSPIDSSTSGGEKMIDAMVDAGPCAMAGTVSCSGDDLLTCNTKGQLPTITPCNWGCVPTAGSGHCGSLVPGGGGVTGSDLDPMTVNNLTANASVSGTIDGSAGTMENLTAGTDFDYHLHGGVAVFRLKSFTVTGDVIVTGPHPIALVADGNITVSAKIDAQGDCNVTNAGPGGFAGSITTPSGSGAGHGATGHMGGGGGGNGGKGGNASSNVIVGGSAFDSLTVLVGGGGGGGGGGNTGFGGGGGGAIQLVSNGTITIASGGSINAGGCQGTGATNGGDGGGGGGAGGTILLEAVIISVVGQLVVNGGGGGGANNGTDGSLATLGRTPAAGGTSGGGGGTGGSGAAGSSYGGGSTASNGGNGAGGGGGGIGRIRLETKGGSGATVDNTMMSPALDDPAPSPAVSGSAVTQ